jgi:hypothetical protein
MKMTKSDCKGLVMFPRWISARLNGGFLQERHVQRAGPQPGLQPVEVLESTPSCSSLLFILQGPTGRALEILPRSKVLLPSLLLCPVFDVFLVLSELIFITPPPRHNRAGSTSSAAPPPGPKRRPKFLAS